MIAQSNPYIAVLDTCVLAPMPLCDTLLRLAEDPAFYIPKWSPGILRELRSTLQRMGYTPAQAERRIGAMESAFEDASVTGYERLVEAMTNDPKDRHVLAAAVCCGAHAIITQNVKHFQPEGDWPRDLDILTPGETEPLPPVPASAALAHRGNHGFRAASGGTAGWGNRHLTRKRASRVSDRLAIWSVSV